MDGKKFDSAKSFINTMMDNEGVIFYDNYGRQWKYENYKFYFKDIPEYAIMKEGLECLHLFGTYINYEGELKCKI